MDFKDSNMHWISIVEGQPVRVSCICFFVLFLFLALRLIGVFFFFFFFLKKIFLVVDIDIKSLFS